MGVRGAGLRLSPWGAAGNPGNVHGNSAGSMLLHPEVSKPVIPRNEPRLHQVDSIICTAEPWQMRGSLESEDFETADDPSRSARPAALRLDERCWDTRPVSLEFRVIPTHATHARLPSWCQRKERNRRFVLLDALR